MKTLLLSIALLAPTVMPLSADQTDLIITEQYQEYNRKEKKEKLTLIFDRHLSGDFYIFYMVITDEFTGKLKKGYEVIVHGFGKNLKKGAKVTRKLALVGKYTISSEDDFFVYDKHYDVFK